MWSLLWKGKCRIYFNSSQEAPYIWSVDNGTIDEERKVKQVIILCSGFRTMQRTENDPPQPKVWLEHYRCGVYINNETMEIKVTY